MKAVLLTGHGGLDKLEYREDIEIPEPDPGEVLVRVKACGLYNTDINTRTAWYSKHLARAQEFFMKKHYVGNIVVSIG